MGVTLARGLIGGLGVVLVVAGLVVAAAGPAGNVVSFLFLILPGRDPDRRRRLRAAALPLAARPTDPATTTARAAASRRRPSPGSGPTDERFVDPTTGVQMRVFLDPTTGERRYVAER